MGAEVVPHPVPQFPSPREWSGEQAVDSHPCLRFPTLRRGWGANRVGAEVVSHPLPQFPHSGKGLKGGEQAGWVPRRSPTPCLSFRTLRRGWGVGAAGRVDAEMLPHPRASVSPP